MINSTKIKVTLPGQRLYNEDTYLDPFRISDVRELFLISKTDDASRLVSLVGRRLSLPVMELYSADFWWILHWQRINSYPQNPMKIKWRCRHCNQTNASEIKSENLVEKPLDLGYNESDMVIDLPSSKGLVGIRLQKVRDEYDVKDYYKNVEKIFPDMGQMREGLIAAMLMIDNMSLAEKIKYVREKLTPDDSYVIDQFETEFKYGIENYVQVKCNNKECGESAEVALDFSLTSFFPSVSDAGSVRTRVFSKKALENKSAGLGDDGVLRSSLDERSSSAGNTGNAESSRQETTSESTPTISEITANR